MRLTTGTMRVDALAVKVLRDEAGRRMALAWSICGHVGLAAVVAWASLSRPAPVQAGAEPVEMMFEAPAPAADAAPPKPDPAPEVPSATPELADVPVPQTAAEMPPAETPPAETSPKETPAAPPVETASPASAEAKAPVPKPAATLPTPPAVGAAPQPPRHVPHPAPVPRRPSAPTRAGLERAAERAEAPASPAAVAPAPAVTQAPAAVDPGWRSTVSAWLLAHKRYPDAARQRGEAGVVGVAFSVARDGRVLVVSVTSSSGSAMLDDAVREMLDRQRLPAFPAEMTQPETQLSVKIRYTLQ